MSRVENENSSEIEQATGEFGGELGLGNDTADIVLTTLGSAGDVVPFLHVRNRLKAKGHHVTVLSHCHYRSLARLLHVFFAPSQVETWKIRVELFMHTLAADINRVRARVNLLPVGDWYSWLGYSDCSIALWPDWFAAPNSI